MSFLAKLFKKKEPASPRAFYYRSGGTTINPETSMEVSAYYRGVVYISSQIAKLPCDIKDDNNKKQYNNVWKILNRSSNNEITSFYFRLLMIQTAINKGNAFAEIERDILGRVKALWFLPTEYVSLGRSAKGELYYRVMGGGDNGQDILLRSSDVFHLKNLYTKDGLTGMSTIAYAAETLGIAKGSDIMANSLMANMGMPSGIISVTGTLKQDTATRMKAQWTEAHAGRKSGGIAVMEEGAKYEAVSLNPEALQLLQQRKFSVVEIARFLGLPPTKLFDTEASTYNNIEHSNLEVATDTLDSWARNWESEVDMKLLDNSRILLKSELDLYQVFRGDMETRGKYFTQMAQTASITPNEIREKEGMEPYAEGNRFFVATNNFTPADRVDEVIDSQVKKDELVKKDTTEEQLNKAALNYLERR